MFPPCCICQGLKYKTVVPSGNRKLTGFQCFISKFKFAVFRQQSEVVASLKSDKDALETTLYEAQQLNAQLETRKEQLEGENQELILKKENLMGKSMIFQFTLAYSG